ncbi:MAG: hypothetical protein ABUK20_14065 [Anaerolineales bacterium]
MRWRFRLNPITNLQYLLPTLQSSTPDKSFKKKIEIPAEDKVLCETPIPGKQPTRIARWKYGLVCSAILAVVPADEQGLEFNKLPELVEGQLSPNDLENLGSVSWYTTTVKLDLEVKDEIERVPGSKVQRLRRMN